MALMDGVNLEKIRTDGSKPSETAGKTLLNLLVCQGFSSSGLDLENLRSLG